MMLLIHLLMNSGSVECTFETFSRVYSDIIFPIISFFQKLIKGGLNNSGGGVGKFSKITKRGTIIRYSSAERAKMLY